MIVAQGRGSGVFGSFGAAGDDLPLADPTSGAWIGGAPATSSKSAASKALLFASAALLTVGVVMAVRGK